ncbi:LOW QUALITY PROTEIN: hypothetical protein PHMEG_0004723 [Phytophthora megakarya]|uniref:Uncharacterized protein n=1 Tax=Phytophthora megakarya TaxID=4795 RepID=A0A225WT60_9STRA|nr:LOW QUALITY PROTEIN: hypothetical protein PHMEG_0004723 [Phytophthora megakarya]
MEVKRSSAPTALNTNSVVESSAITLLFGSRIVRLHGYQYYIFVKPKGCHNHALSRELWEY